MSKQSSRKKLIVAASSLLISAIMLATSTYVWFTMNKGVEVRNLITQTKAESNLLFF